MGRGGEPLELAEAAAADEEEVGVDLLDGLTDHLFGFAFHDHGLHRHLRRSIEIGSQNSHPPRIQ